MHIHHAFLFTNMQAILHGATSLCILMLPLFYSPKSGYGKDSAVARKFLLGTSFTAMKQVSSIDAITAGAEIYYDDALRSTKEVFIGDTSSNILGRVINRAPVFIKSFCV